MTDRVHRKDGEHIGTSIAFYACMEAMRGESVDLKSDLLRLDAYGALKPARVDLAETHASWVFLLEHDVFKIKRPVDLGFLDFRTIERRKAACEAEVRLNARLAPHVYRGVVPVRRAADGRCTIDGDGEVVDWAVHMIRLPDHRRADMLLATKQLFGAQIDVIAQRLAKFHARARIDPDAARSGTPRVIQNMEENFSQAAPLIRRYLSADDAEAVVRWQRAFVRGHAALFDERIRKSRVRDGHGDLRLEHIYFDADSATVIDCIEFNERFRIADVCADAAFLSMDLVGHGRVDLAERFLATYAREADDFDLYALVDFYESYRAFVRGKVSAMIADDPEIGAEARRSAVSDARRHFLLALSATRRALLMPAVVAVGGIIASGKSTIAERIGSEMSAPVISADRTRKAMLGVEAKRPLHESAWRGSYDPAFTERVYEEILRRAAVVLDSGRPVVLDASFRSSAMRRAARELADLHNVPFRFIECRAESSLCRARLREREGGVSDGRLEIFDAFCARFEAVDELPSPEHIVIDTSCPLDESVGALCSRLDTWPMGFVA